MLAEFVPFLVQSHLHLLLCFALILIAAAALLSPLKWFAEVLYLDENDLVGSIPSELGRLTSLGKCPSLADREC